jgi:thymidylate synthase
MSYADQVFKQNIRRILEEGVSDENMQVRPHWKDGTPAHTISVFGVVNRYDLAKEFPIMTLRRTYWKSAWDEISWIWQKKSNNIHDLHSHVWDEWADETGSIGKAYGYQMGVLSRYKDVTKEGLEKAFGDDLKNRHIEQDEDGVFKLDQVDRVIYQLVNTPASRRILTMMYNPHDLSEMALYPCAYSMTFNVVGGKLNAILNQRSQDMITANNWNVVQASLIVYALASAYGFEVGELVHCIANCHIYMPYHLDIAKHLLEAPEHEAPKFSIDQSIKNFYDFDKNSFHLENYDYNDFDYKIEIAV